MCKYCYAFEVCQYSIKFNRFNQRGHILTNSLFAVLLLLLLAFLPVSAQESKSDSLSKVWNNTALNDTLRFEAGLDLFMIHFRSDLDSARTLGKRLAQFAKTRNRPNWEATAARFVGNTYAVQGDYIQALDAFTHSYELLSTSEDELSIATTLSNIGTVHYELGNYPEAIKNLLGAMSTYENLENRAGLSRVTNNLGNIYLRQKNEKKALEYYTYSLSIKKELGNKSSLPSTYNNIALVHSNLKQFDLALKNLLISADLSRELGDELGYTRAYSNIGDVYNRLGQYNKALEYLNPSINTKKNIGDKEGLSAAYLYRGQSYLFKNNFEKARIDCDRSLQLGRTMGATMLIKEACECLSNAYEGIGDTRTALSYFKQASEIKDSLFTQDKAQEITRQEMQYEFEKQQLADSIAFHKQRTERELLFQRDLNQERNKLNLIVFGGLALLIIAGIYWRSRQKDKKLQRERAMVNRLKQIDQLKDQFLANTSHELRTPLNGIIGLTESLKDGAAGPLSKPAVENLDLIVQSGKRLSNLVNDILDFSKLKNRDLELNIKAIDLHAVADVVVKLLGPMAAEKQIKLVNSISSELPLVEADENRLQQILFNLVGNAIKFTPKGQVEIRSDITNGKMMIEVIDTGIGIPEDKFESIFNSFEQGDGSVAREYGGTGLGLSVTKQLVELHKGSIDIRSEVNKGSTFSFTLPLSAEERPEIIKSTPKAETLSKLSEAISSDAEDIAENLAEPISDRKILVVDDEPINRKVLENHLKVAGYQMEEARSGEEAISKLTEEHGFDLVLLDIMMPGLSGFEVCEKIRETHTASELPVIMLTAKNRVSDLVNGFNSGANDYLSKPFSKNELLSRLKTHLNLKGIHRATSKFVPTEFLKSVGREHITEVVLGDHVEKKVTVLFSDIREYTKIAEGMTPRQNFKFINSYVGKMGPVIQANNGFVNHYLGDGILALFPHTPREALQSAIDMQKAIHNYNKRREKEGYLPISVGMGLHTGPLIMGIIGDHLRNDTAIISDTVNAASRLEGITKFYGAQIILSEDSLKAIKDQQSFGLRFLGRVKVMGKEKSLGIYECFDGDREEESIRLKTKNLKLFEKGIDLFMNGKFPKASAAFDKVLSQNPQDRVARYFVSKSAEFTLSGFPEDWDVVTSMDEK